MNTNRLKKKVVGRFSFLSCSLGIVYLWFGALKFFPGVSPAEGLASETIVLLTFNLLDARLALILLAIWECTLGLFLLLNVFRRITIPFALLHILLTFSPLFLLPAEVFTAGPLTLTLTGQYIIKNLVIVAVLFTLWDTRKAHPVSAS
ncbi:doxx family protein [Muriicola sp.]|uniref:doxx family protein n=1 Tax=Muriicola sp. TaxID=2020856 RepID=UPI0035647AF1